MENTQELMGKDVFEKLRDNGNLLAISNTHNGKNCPANKQLIKCNLNTVVTMAWGPIGQWDTLDNGVLRLASESCYVTLYKTSGLKIELSFSQGDLRYVDGDWMTMYINKKPEYQMLRA